MTEPILLRDLLQQEFGGIKPIAWDKKGTATKWEISADAHARLGILLREAGATQTPTDGVTCPNCQAPPGSPCTMPTSQGRSPISWLHSARILEPER